MTKEDYIEKVNELIKWMNIQTEIDEASCGSIVLWDNDPLQRVLSSYMELLSETANDPPGEYGSMLEYFMYECDYGDSWEPGMITDSDGSDIKLQTVEDLANYLFKDK